MEEINGQEEMAGLGMEAKIYLVLKQAYFTLVVITALVFVFCRVSQIPMITFPSDTFT